jgi:hypothetical protein
MPLNFPPLVFTLGPGVQTQIVTIPSGIFVFIPPHSFILSSPPASGPQG